MSAAALAVIATIGSEGLLAHAERVGRRVREGLGAEDRVTEVRGEGLLIGVSLTSERAPDVVTSAQERGWIVNATTPDRVRLAPPLVLTDADADAFVAAWPDILDGAQA